MKGLLLAVIFAGAVCAQGGRAAENGRATPQPAATQLAQAPLAQAAPAQGAAPQVCTEVYQPVCGTNQSGMRVTYSNACFARAASATNVSPGECANTK